MTPKANPSIKRISVFCGSSPGIDPAFVAQATALGRKLATERIALVYGGARVGLMGAVADGVLAAGGEAIGVLPGFLSGKEIAHAGLTELILVDSMHERKTRMHELCDGVIALPGGFGTLEELFEMLTWGQLGLHQKPIGILNVNGFYDDLIAFLNTVVERGLLKAANRGMLLTSDRIDDLLQQMREYIPSRQPKWIGIDEV